MTTSIDMAHSSAAPAGCGRANRKPCIREQPLASSTSRCASVSTPSATTFRPSPCATPVRAWTRLRAIWLVSSALSGHKCSNKAF